MISNIKNLPFTPSPYCNPKVKPHRRIERDEDLIGNPQIRAVGICKICGWEKRYPHEDLSRYGSINIPSERRDFILFRDKHERVTHMSRHLAGGA
jgi:RNase P subunit RPR2